MKTLRKSLARASNLMPTRPHQKPPPTFSKKPEFAFHLVAKQTSAGATGVIAGAIVAGPVAALFNDALGTAFEGESEITSAKTNSLKSDSKKKSAKPKAKR